MDKKHRMLLPIIAVIFFMMTSTAAAAEFSDMPDDWSTAALENAVANGLIVGIGDRILPNADLTRAEMATIINRAFGAVDKASLSAYTDVPADAWYYDEMAKAVKMKTFVGSGGKLDPDSSITREEAFVVLARAFKLYGASERALDRFSDKSSVSWWAEDGAASLAAEGYIAGSYGRIDPKKTITRAEFAQMMDNLTKAYIRSTGTYTADVDGNVIVNAPGITLKDLKIDGDLIIGDGAGKGQVVLDNIQVEGRTVIRSGPGSVRVVGAFASPETLEASDYFPVKENVRYIYAGMGNEYASYDVYIDYTSSSKIQQRVDNGGTVMARVIEHRDGTIARLLSLGETYYRENLLEASDASAEILLMEPLRAGASWTLPDGRVRTIAGTSDVVDTPSGSYIAIAVVTKGEYSTITEHYAKDFGLVRSLFVSGETEVRSTLEEIQVNAARPDAIRFYYPNINDGRLYYKDRQVDFRTNDVTADILAAAYKETPAGGVGKVFSPNTKINSLYLGAGNKVMLDLNRAFLTEMNAGAQYETMILSSIANTFGQYYNAQEVVITIENRPYASGHIEMKEGQSFPVDLEEAIEIE